MDIGIKGILPPLSWQWDIEIWRVEWVVLMEGNESVYE